MTTSESASTCGSTFPLRWTEQLAGVFLRPTYICGQYHASALAGRPPLPVVCAMLLVVFAITGSAWTGAWIGAAVLVLGARDGALRMNLSVGPCWPLLLPVLFWMNRLSRPRLPFVSLGFVTFVVMTHGTIAHMTLAPAVWIVGQLTHSRALVIPAAVVALTLGGARMWIMQYRLIRRLGGQPTIVVFWWMMMVAMAVVLGVQFQMFGAA